MLSDLKSHLVNILSSTGLKWLICSILVLLIVIVKDVIKIERFVLIQVKVHALIHVFIFVSCAIILNSAVNLTTLVHMNCVVCKKECILNIHMSLSVEPHVLRVDIDVAIVCVLLELISNLALDINGIDMILNLKSSTKLDSS